MHAPMRAQCVDALPAGTPHVPVAIVGAGACGLTRGDRAARRRHRLRAAGARRRAAGLDRAVVGLHPGRRHARRSAQPASPTAPQRLRTTSRPRRTARAAPHLVQAYTAGHRPGAGRAAAAPRPALRAARRLSLPGPSRAAHAHAAAAHRRRAGGARCEAAADAAGATLLTHRAGRASCGAMPRGRVHGVGYRRPDGTQEHLGCARCCWPATASAATRRWCASCCPRCATHCSPATPATTAAPSPGAALLGARAGRPGRLPGPRLVGGAARRADDLGGDDRRRHAGQRRRPALPRRDAAVIRRRRCAVLAQPGRHGLERVRRPPAGAGARVPGLRRSARTPARCAHAADARRAGRRCIGCSVGPLPRTLAAARALAPPYHAVRVTGALFHTQGGLDIDAALPRAARGRPAAAQPAGRRRRRARRVAATRCGATCPATACSAPWPAAGSPQRPPCNKSGRADRDRPAQRPGRQGHIAAVNAPSTVMTRPFT